MRKLLCGALCALFLLSSFCFAFAEETADLNIASTEDFLAFAESCRLDSYSQGLTVSLSADIDLSGTDFSGVPIFCGTFLGNGHHISGVSITAAGSAQGLFRYLTQSATVQDLHISGTVAPTGSRSTIGGIAGQNAGIIKNCSFSGDVSGVNSVGGIAGINTVTGIIENCQTSGRVQGVHFAGGIAGTNNGVIRSCENIADINTSPKQNNIDISDITLETITGTESAGTVTDLGGIAGTSTGTIRLCTNQGDVGYKHIGYNLGGIAGSQSGFLTECKNTGDIYGRKDVGGIAGHMEPAITFHYETDTLQLLKVQLTILSDLTDRAALNAKENTATIRNLIATLEMHISNAQSALDTFSVDPENPELKDVDAYTAALQTLNTSILGIETTVRNLTQALEDTTNDLENDLNAIADQTAVIEVLLNSGEETLGGSLQDVSDADTKEDLSSKISVSLNMGAVLGDHNVGGIVGVMALENDLDPEKDVYLSGEYSLNVSGQIRSVVRDCTNNGNVSAKKQYAGGIAGKQTLGLITDCLGLGDLESTDYVGGIAGQSLGYIRSCSARCIASGSTYVGGIAGSAAIVTDCRAVVSVSGAERVGAILGSIEDNYSDIKNPIASNLYTPSGKDIGAIDAISYRGLAEPCALEDFIALEGLPEVLKTVSITFLFSDYTSDVLILPLGATLEADQIPALPEIEGESGRWEGLEALGNILFNTTLKAQYTRHNQVGASEAVGENGKPVFLIQGDLSSGFSVSTDLWDNAPTLADKEILLESRSISFSNNDTVEAVRYLLPKDADTSALKLYVHSPDGNWSVADHTVQGSYIIFSPECQIDGIALTYQPPVQIPWGLITIAAIAILAIVFFLLRKKKATRK